MVQRTMSRKCNDRAATCKTCNCWFGVLALALPAALAACAPMPAERSPAPIVAGGWQAADPKGEGVQPAAAYAAEHLPQGTGQLAEVTSAETQVVAGTNLRMVLRMTDGARWRVTVWHRLDGSFELTDAQKTP